MFIIERVPTRVSLNSDFRVGLSEIVDKNGVPVSIDTTAFHFKFYSRTGGGIYNVIWVPGKDNAKYVKNCYEEDGILFINFTGYKFQVGPLMVKVGLMVNDEHFPDGVWDWWYDEQESGIVMTP